MYQCVSADVEFRCDVMTIMTCDDDDVNHTCNLHVLWINKGYLILNTPGVVHYNLLNLNIYTTYSF